MKRTLILTAFIFLSLLFVLSSCEIPHICKIGSWETEIKSTCTEEGLNVRKCIFCKKIIETETVSTAAHSFGFQEPQTRETDEECPELIYFKTCKLCGYEEIIETVKKHNYKVVTTYSTCTTLGYDTLTCISCGALEVRHHTDLGPHNYAYDYLSDGDFHWRKCTNCDEFIERDEHLEDESGICTVCDTKVGYTDGIIYELSDDKSYATVTGYTGSNKRIRIMPEYEGVPVTHIGKSAFAGNYGLYSISLTENITHIADQAFYDCLYLEYAWRMGNVKYIGDGAFQNNYMLEISTLPQSLEYIGKCAFYHCQSIRVSVIPDSVTYIGSEAFYHCNRINSIKIGSSLTEIKDDTFNYCFNLANLEFGENLISIGNRAFKDCYYIEAIIFPDSLVSIGEDSFSHCNRLVSVYLGKSFETFGNRAFQDCFELKEINANKESEHFTSVDGIAYSKDLSTLMYYPVGRDDKELKIPEGVKAIADYAFIGAARIKSVTLPTTLTDIGLRAFGECENLESVTILGATRIGDYAFINCSKLSELNLSEGVSSIGQASFLSTGFVELVIPDSVTSMGVRAFASCYNLRKVTIGAGLKNIPEEAFIYNGSYLNTVIISEGVETIGERAFAYCYFLRRLSIADSVKSIGDSAFNHCTRLTVIEVGSGLSEVGKSAFAESEQIQNVYYKGSSEDWSKINIKELNLHFKSPSAIYYYSENMPDNTGKYWYYNEDGNIAIWKNDAK